MNREKTVIFTTSDIVDVQYNEIAENRAASDLRYEGVETGVKFYTTGKLEKALSEGYEVWVVTSRDKLSNHDKWWVELLGEERVIMAPACHARDWRAIVAWEDFVVYKLCENLPKNIVGWPDFFPALKKMGYKLGGDF
jgi:hypothetical protein